MKSTESRVASYAEGKEDSDLTLTFGIYKDAVLADPQDRKFSDVMAEVEHIRALASMKNFVLKAQQAYGTLEGFRLSLLLPSTGIFSLSRTSIQKIRRLESR